MNNNNTTPPVCRTLFSVKGNEENLKSFTAKGYKFEIAYGYACYEGATGEHSALRKAFSGAVTA